MILTVTQELHYTPSRIISLVPSQTALLHHLNLDKEVIGITKFCIHPSTWFREKTRIGGTKSLHIEKIIALQPDLLIANREENNQQDVELLAETIPVWVTDVKNLPDAIQMILDVGTLTRKIAGSQRMAETILDLFQKLSRHRKTIRTAYLIWKDPYMTVGTDTFIHDMMTRAGFENIYHIQSRYPECSLEEIRQLGCELVLLSSEPYPFKQKHIDELSDLLPDTKIVLVNGEMFSWYGSHLLDAPAYLNQLYEAVTQNES
jgi:ABC-type Fe3+-hydroxamate transport system substrate-binding protein